MVDTKMMAVEVGLLKELEGLKIIPRESYSDCLGRVIKEYKELKGLSKVENDEEVGVKEDLEQNTVPVDEAKEPELVSEDSEEVEVASEPQDTQQPQADDYTCAVKPNFDEEDVEE